jgi:hypothetical protein
MHDSVRATFGATPRATLGRLAMIGAICAALGTPLPAAAGFLASGAVASESGSPARWQLTEVTPVPESAGRGEGDRPDLEDVLYQQGADGIAALQQIAAVEVVNPLPVPARAIEIATTPEPTPEVDASATAAAEVALAVEATVVAREAEAAAAADLAAAQATATATARDAAATATATARTLAAREKAMQAASLARSTPAAAVTTAAPPPQEASAQSQFVLLPIALLPVLAGLLGFLLWRREREPFVLKAKPGGT